MLLLWMLIWDLPLGLSYPSPPHLNPTHVPQMWYTDPPFDPLTDAHNLKLTFTFTIDWLYMLKNVSYVSLFIIWFPTDSQQRADWVWCELKYIFFLRIREIKIVMLSLRQIHFWEINLPNVNLMILMFPRFQLYVLLSVFLLLTKTKDIKLK